jgi:Fur family zinc uptake transcriptional regulator
MSDKAHAHVHEPRTTPQQAIEDAIAHAHARCGQRLTATREAVLRLLLGENRPMTAYELLDLLGTRTGRSRNPPTIYRALEFLSAEGFVSRLESLNAYTLCSHIGTPHACLFFICTCCGEAAEVTDADIEAQLRALAGAIGFRADHPVVEVDGLCRQCHDAHAEDVTG